MTLSLTWAVSACGSSTDNGSDSAATTGTQTLGGSSATSSNNASGGAGTTNTSGTTGSGGAATSASTGSNGATTGTVVTGSGGVEQCPPCVPPPSPDCVGSGPCGCGPYTCPDTTSTSSTSGGTELSCLAVSGDYGDCDAVLGYAFDGSVCRAFSGCSCGADCAHFFPSAAECANACGAAGQCHTDALMGGGIANAFSQDVYCDEVFACAPESMTGELGQVLTLTGACETTSSCTTLTCPVTQSATIDAETWASVCRASLLPDVELTCWVWGP